MFLIKTTVRFALAIIHEDPDRHRGQMDADEQVEQQRQQEAADSPAHLGRCLPACRLEPKVRERRVLGVEFSKVRFEPAQFLERFLARRRDRCQFVQENELRQSLDNGAGRQGCRLAAEGTDPRPRFQHTATFPADHDDPFFLTHLCS